MVQHLPTSETAALLNERYTGQKILGTRLGRQTLLGYDHRAQQPVILKYLCFDDPIQPADVQRFQREIRVLKSLSHSAIPSYLDDFEIDTSDHRGLVLVQSYIDGTSLYQQIQSGRRFNEAELRQLAKQLLEILQYLHLHQPALIHRDLKPSNLVLADRSAHTVGKVYLIDFGLVQDSTETSPLTIAGTDGYRPPEQLGDRATPASDMYCLGMTLIHLATGCHPAELPRRGLKVLFAQELGDFSRPFKHWLRWLTEVRQEKRPGSAQEALKVLAQAEDVFPKRFVASALPPKFANPLKQHCQLFESLKPFGSRLHLLESPHTLEIVIPALGLQGALMRQASCQTLAGLGGLLLLGITGRWVGYRIALSLLAAGPGAAMAAASLACLLITVSTLQAWRGLLTLVRQLNKKVRIQLEPDVLLVGYDYPARPIEYVVNARKQDIFDIVFKPDASNLYLLLKCNRTVQRQLNYRLSAEELALAPDEMRWLNDLLSFWFKRVFEK
ncbi:MAG: serine/threonine-protein kinase [Cyanobacteria bacterium P01_A01_bin.114]